MTVRGEKLSGDPWSASVLWIGMRALFLESNMILLNLLGQCERLLYADCVRYVWASAIRGLSMGCLWRVDQVSATGCTSI
jgi:hypothetical protein